MIPRALRHAMWQVGLRQREIANALARGSPTVSRILAGAYVVRRESARLTVNRVRGYVTDRLVMVPADLVVHLAPIPRQVGPCGDPAHVQVRDCTSCHNAYQRARRPNHSDLPEPARRRANARAHANIAQRRDQLVPQPCEVCGVEPAEKHHDDYAKPLEIRWLCPTHHRAHHRSATNRKQVSHETDRQPRETFEPVTGASR